MKWLITYLLLGLQFAAVSQATHMYVALDGTANFTSVQAALDAVPMPNEKPVVIHIKPGVYREVLVLDSGKNFVSFKGEAGKTTRITYNNHSGKALPDGKVANTMTSASFFIFANDFSAENIHFENDAGFSAGQAVAVRAEGDRLYFRNCKFTGFQDVLLLNKRNALQYFKSCYIEGTTDFIFGNATAFFEDCRIHSRKNSYITAASTDKSTAVGFVFYKCTLTADTSTNKVHLGRPWQPYASVTYGRCKMGKHIVPAGWHNWNDPKKESTARFSEFRNEGEGADTTGRVKWSKQLTASEAKSFSRKNVLGDWKPTK